MNSIKIKMPLRIETGETGSDETWEEHSRWEEKELPKAMKCFEELTDKGYGARIIRVKKEIVVANDRQVNRS